MAVELKGLGLVTVASSAAPAQVSATSIRTPGASLQAPAANTGNIRIGNSAVSTTYAVELRPGECVEITGPLIRGMEDEFDLSQIYIDVDVNGEGAIVAYWARNP